MLQPYCKKSKIATYYNAAATLLGAVSMQVVHTTSISIECNDTTNVGSCLLFVTTDPLDWTVDHSF